MTDYVAILSRRYAGKEWWIAGNDYATLEWLSDGTKPSKATLDGLWASVQQEITDEATAKVAARQAVLDKLGLTADEVTALLG
jgi:hypothetical protein